MSEPRMYLKACPRCGGDQALERDFYGSYVSCLTCGYVAYPDNGIVPPVSAASVEETGRPRLPTSASDTKQSNRLRFLDWVQVV